MDRVTEADLSLHRNSGLGRSPPPSQNICKGPYGQLFVLKFGCVFIILVLTVVGLRISVMPIQKCSLGKHIGTHASESMKNTKNPTGSPLLLTCPKNWKQQGKKCLDFSSSPRTWNDSQVHCSRKGARLLLIQDENELNEIIRNLKEDKKTFWIGLKFSSPEKKWKWINGSFLTPNVLQIYGDATENSCALISQTKILAENCDGENYYICQIKL